MTLVEEPTAQVPRVESGEIPTVESTFYDFNLKLERQDLDGQTAHMFDQTRPVRSSDAEQSRREPELYGRGPFTAKKTGKHVGYLRDEPEQRLTSRSHTHSYERRYGRVKGFIGGAVTATVVIVAIMDLWPSSTVDTGDGTSGKVVAIVPSELDQRAVVTADVKTGVHRNAGGLMGDALRLTGLAHTFQMTADFRGPKGKGGGEISTEVKVYDLDVRTVNEPDGSQEVIIPAKDIVLKSVINDGKSEVVDDNGDAYTYGAAEIHVSPFSVKNDVANNQGNLDQVARAEAINYMQQSCDKGAWPLTLRAITKAYENIAINDVMIERAGGANIKPFDPKKFSVVVTGGTPSFPPAYTFNHNAGYSFTQGQVSKCTIAKGALKLSAKNQ